MAFEMAVKKPPNIPGALFATFFISFSDRVFEGQEFQK